MTDLMVVGRAKTWDQLKSLVLDSVSSPIRRRVYNMALDEFIEWYQREPQPGGFSKAIIGANGLLPPVTKLDSHRGTFLPAI